MNFIQSILWDSKANGYSASRLVMIGGFCISALISVTVLFIFVYSFFNRPTPIIASDLLPWAGGAAGLGSVGYGMNRIGTMGDPIAGADAPEDPADENEAE